MDHLDAHSQMIEKLRQAAMTAMMPILLSKEFEALSHQEQVTATLQGPLAAAVGVMVASAKPEGHQHALAMMTAMLPEVYKVVMTIPVGDSADTLN